MKLERRHLVTAATIAAVIAIGVYLARPDVVPVDVGTISRGPLRVTIDEDGETRVRERYVISSPVAGRLTRLACEVGDTVAVGQVLAHVFPMPLDTRARAEAAGRLEAAEASRRAAEARVEQARSLWSESRRALDRLERVSADVPGSVSGQQIDAAQTAERTAALALQEAENVMEAAVHEVQSARATLAGSDGTTGEPTVVRSPAGGRVLRLYEECERIVVAGSPIVEVGDPRQLEVVVDVLSEDAGRLVVGASATVTLGPEEGTLAAHVTRVEPSAFTKVSPLGVEEQRVNVILTLESHAVMGDRYRVNASLVTWESDDVLLVPTSALFRDGSLWSVFVIEGGRARLRHVELGAQGTAHAEVRGGLAQGDSVVLHPSESVADGVPVEPVSR
jgi:HlyD family secretion protein